MRLLYLFARLFPFFGICGAVVFFEAGRHFRRRGQDYQYYCWFWVVVLTVLTLVWFLMRGDLHSDRWVKLIFES